MIEPASTLDMDDDTRGRMITRCVAYMTQRKIPIRDTRAVTRLLASNAGRIDGATNVKVRSYLTDTPAETFQSLETMKQWMGMRTSLWNRHAPAVPSTADNGKTFHGSIG